MIFDDRQCALGEGALWHSDRDALIWFDILGRRMFMRALDSDRQEWRFDDHVSAAGIVDRDRLLVASSRALSLFDLRDGTSQELVPLEADKPVTRSNDGRADPQGGFWIGTIGLSAEEGAGSIWRYHKGEIRRLFPDITITNAICFTPDGRMAHFADTARSTVWRVALDADGWPAGDPQPWLDLSAEGLNPDGAVIDTQGGFWTAQWGASRVARYDAEGRFDRAIDMPARHVSCPAFGGPDLTTLFATSALQGLDDPAPEDGCVFHAPAGIAGQPEYRVLID
ncbi:SMP-30/gluconolactonase/LRE family protein [Paracoccus sp. 1_MG-2023]|uniref:SMP-30/gluconolactonase/LRE family protein n=1 Tax=unclassified Paracoccus (in: a-proteobacteria) TaxID=2688777 RepID=UPI001C08B5AC|nr:MULTISPECIES: SMP-30/gluconolactonase/LRE family protein [unclassified Paracoccus (in: a-proteobacteria)]MBU2957787.1 SMP-30/gluconolactonase/LRE family protein [Paracoccus sp. C2R09]MDO6667365.1 SMP-30/gluconolactonase/LRE family protein [Paracoccus sp. 1_MG-2023]